MKKYLHDIFYNVFNYIVNVVGTRNQLVSLRQFLYVLSSFIFEDRSIILVEWYMIVVHSLTHLITFKVHDVCILVQYYINYMIPIGNYRYHFSSYVNHVVRRPNNVLDYAKLLVKTGNFKLETRLGPDYKLNVESYKFFVPQPQSDVTTGDNFYVLAHLFFVVLCTAKNH